MNSSINRQWRLAARPVGAVKETDFEFTQESVPSPSQGEILVRNIYLSLDPTNRNWASDNSYLSPISIGDVMLGATIGIVEQSNNDAFPKGSIVQGLLQWQDYSITDGSGLTILPNIPSIPLTAHFGLFGHIGLSAYFALLDIGKPNKGETLVVSAAAGAVGSLVGQIGKIKGCHVVGIAGSDEKCRWITDELGFDAAINYKEESVLDSLTKLCPDGIDVYFDNVGGEILEAVLNLININARLVICGMISQYNNTKPQPGPSNLSNLISKRALMEGFLVLDYMQRANEAIQDLGKWYSEGKLQYRIDLVDGLEQAPSALNKLFDGSNKGKLIIKISDDPSS